MADEAGYVYQATLGQSELASLLTRLFSRCDAMIARRVNAADFLSPNTADTEALTADEAARWLEQWDEAQIFNATAELRWRRQGASYAALLLSEQPVNSLLGEADEMTASLQSLTAAPFVVRKPSMLNTHGFLLWGTRADKEEKCWWEARIPRRLSYQGFPPKNDKAKPPQLTYKLYQDGETVRWIRLVKLEEATNNE
jgi:hypothetical protein